MSISKMFNDFLKSNENFCVLNFDDNENQIYLMKVAYNNSNIDMIFFCNPYSRNLDERSKFEYGCLYDKEKQKLYDLNYIVRKELLRLNWDDKTYKSSEDILTEYSEKLSKIITDYALKHKKEFYDLVDDYDAYVSNDRVFENVLHGKTKIDYKYKCYLDKFGDVLDYLINDEKFIYDKAMKIIETNKGRIGKDLKDNDKENQLITDIMNDKNNIIHKKKDILNSLKQDNYGKVHVFINKNNINFDFKYSARDICSRWNWNYLSSYQMEAKDRKKFYDLFGYSNDVNYEEIYKIEYRNRPIYVDENFNKKEIEIKNNESELSI